MISGYKANAGLLDEVFTEDGGQRAIYDRIWNKLGSHSTEEYRSIHSYTKDYLRKQGISFVVYSNTTNEQKEDTFPVDLFPRVISAEEWERLEAGMIQRNQAINLFLKDIYNSGHILKDKLVPFELVMSSAGYCREMEGFTPPGDIYTHICGTDLIKDDEGEWRVLEDNVRNPSGVSYVLTNREILKIMYGSLLKDSNILPVSDYTDALYKTLSTISHHKNEPNIVLQTPGVYNSAYFEHGYLARNMGIPLVEGRDLFVDQEEVYMKTIKGPVKVHVIYRRIDDEYMDPLTFNPNSILGVPGLIQAYKAGNISLANAPGCGTADDKAVYAFMPRIIRYYMDQDPIIQNVPTYFCDNESDLKYIEENMRNMVIKPVNMSGGYGILMGHELTKGEMAAQLLKIRHNPRDYIAQPTIKLSTHATYIEEEAAFQPRHVDLRMFSLMGKNTAFVLKGGLTRVALRKDSLIVNSSQGGGSKDTWVMNGAH